MKRIIIISVIISLFCLASVYAAERQRSPAPSGDVSASPVRSVPEGWLENSNGLESVLLFASNGVGSPAKVATASGGTGGKGGAGTNRGGSGGDGSTVIGESTKEKEPKGVDTEEIKRLIENLNSDDIVVRDEATEGLKKIGKPALPSLEEAIKSDIPEVVWRAKIIIKAIEKAERKKPAQEESTESLKKIGPTLKQFSNRFNITINGATPGTKTFALSQDSSGKVTVTITEYDPSDPDESSGRGPGTGKAGKEITKAYTADSLEEFKQKYPDIAREYGIGEPQPPLSIEIPDIDIDDIWKDFGNAWSHRWDDLRKQIDKLRERFGQRGNNRPGPEDEEAPIPTIPRQTDSITTTNLGLCLEPLESSPLKKDLNIENGVLVTGIEANSLGEKIGLKQSDIIISINDSPVGTTWECRRLIKTALSARGGSAYGMKNGKTQLVIIRDGKKQILRYP